VALLAAAPASAQSTATIQGAITDTQNAGRPGVTVTVQNTATGSERTTVTDASGQYVAASLQPGHYLVTAHLDGFNDAKSEFDLGPAQTIPINLKLTVGAIAENVTVTGSSPLIDTATVSVGQVMQEKTVQEIPLNGRHFVDLGPLMPGGSTSPQNAGLSAPLRGQGSFSFMTAGNRETSVNMMINGINLNDLSNSQVTFQPSINTVSEFKVDNSTFSAEYGRNSGAIVNVATRSGSNTFHGEAFDFYRDQQFDARNYFNPEPAAQSTFNRKQFGVNLGGPIAKNKMFFFGSYEGLRHKQGVDLNSGTLSDAQRAAVTDPTAKNLLAFIPKANDSTGLRAIGSELAPVTIDQGTGDVRTNLRQNDDLHVYYAFQSDFRHEPNAQGNTVPGYGDNRGGHRQVLTLNETHVFSSSLVNEVRGGYNRIHISFDPTTLTDTAALGINVGVTQNPAPLPQITITGPGLNFGGPGGFPSARNVTTTAIGDTATYLRGEHVIKFGGEYRHVLHNGLNGDPGSFTYPSIASFQQGFGSAFSITLGGLQYNALVNAFGAFVQDSISLRSNVKLDVGLRYDYLPSPTEADNKLVTFIPSTASLVQFGTNGFDQVTKNGSDFQPRLGVIWNPTADGKLAVRAAYAVMVNQSNTGYFVGEANNPPIVNPLTAQAAGTAASNVKISSALTGSGAAALSPNFTDPNFLPGRMQTWNVNIEREFAGTGVMIGYFGSHGDRQRIPLNFNQFVTPGSTVRPYPKVSATSPINPGATLGNITEQTSLGWSDYKGLWITANRRLSKGLQLSGSYTLSKSTDTNSYDGTLTAQDNTNLADSVGPSDFDVRHRVSVNASYDLPFKGNRWKDGWQVVVVEQAQTGNPLNIVTGISTITGTNNLVRPDLIGALPTINPHPNLDPVTGAVTSYQWFDGQTTVCDPRVAAGGVGACTSASVFALPFNAAGVAHFGNLGRNVIYGPGFGNMDLSLIKNIALVGTTRAQLRVEVFNLFNQANLGQPGRVVAVGSTSLGVISNTRFPTGDSGSARQMQFAVKFMF
jgi:hypothetical protein